MARRRRRRDVSTPSLPDPVSRFLSPQPVTFNSLSDHRYHHPDGPYRPVLSFDDTPATITTAENTNVVRRGRSQSRNRDHDKRTPVRLVFAEPVHPSQAKGIPLCVRRETRREVLFAKGKGGSRHKRKVRRNANSKIGC